MCQGDLGTSDVLTPFEECATDELTRGNPDVPAARAAGIYARRAARLAGALHEVLRAVWLEDQEVTFGPALRASVDQAELILEQESAAAAIGGEVA